MAAILISVTGITKLKTWLAIIEESIYGLINPAFEVAQAGFPLKLQPSLRAFYEISGLKLQPSLRGLHV
jgi:hypothetical protein